MAVVACPLPDRLVPVESAASSRGSSSENIPSGTDAVEARTIALLTRMASTDDPRLRRRIREEVIEFRRPYADFLARRFRHRGEPLEDLRQVAAVGLIKAIDGFDVSRGCSFTAYATPTILGELRRHFRDKGWNMRVPRRLQELRAEIIAATETLTQQLGRGLTTADIAREIGVTEDEVREGISASRAYSAASLQTPVHREEDSAPLSELIAQEDVGFEVVEARESLRSVVGRLPERERRILGLRFFHQLTQSEIAAELGISQMHVSRILSRSLGSLRESMEMELAS